MSLFPLLMGLLPASSAELGQQLHLLRRPDLLWTPFGLRCGLHTATNAADMTLCDTVCAPHLQHWQYLRHGHLQMALFLPVHASVCCKYKLMRQMLAVGVTTTAEFNM